MLNKVKIYFISLPECRNERSVKVTSSAHIC